MRTDLLMAKSPARSSKSDYQSLSRHWFGVETGAGLANSAYLSSSLRQCVSGSGLIGLGRESFLNLFSGLPRRCPTPSGTIGVMKKLQESLLDWGLGARLGSSLKHQ